MVRTLAGILTLVTLSKIFSLSRDMAFSTRVNLVDYINLRVLWVEAD